MARAPLYRWKDNPVGCKGLCLILLYAQGKAGDKLLDGNPGDYGINGEEMLKWVLERLPELEQHHLKETGQPLTARKMMGRFYNMFDILPSGKRKPSGEHPAVHQNVASTWVVMAGIQQDLFQPV